MFGAGQHMNEDFKKLSKEDIDMIVNITKDCQALSRSEIAATICENLNLRNGTGNLRVQHARKILESLNSSGLIELPKLQEKIHHQTECCQSLQDIANKSEIVGSVQLFQPKVELVKTGDNQLWRDLVNQYHYLGYKANIGTHLRYFILLEEWKEPVGCISFVTTGCKNLDPRDEEIGWNMKERELNINCIINNNRFVIFPWIKIKNLGSKALTIALKRVVNDWSSKFGFKPYLAETFVDPTRFTGSIYKASGWKFVGETTAKKRKSNFPKKHIFLYPLTKDYRSKLKKQDISSENIKYNIRPSTQIAARLRKFEKELDLIELIQLEIAKISRDLDNNQFRQAKKVDAMSTILGILKLAHSKNDSYPSLICELLDNANAHGVKLSFSDPISPSSFCEARKKIPYETMERILHFAFNAYENVILGKHDYLWFGRRIFAVDGSKVNLDKALMLSENGSYRLPCSHAYYPQGLLSTLYRLKTQMPVDVRFTNSMDEQAEALKHLEVLITGDVIVYDRGYLSYALIHQHKSKGIDAIFRLKKSSFKAIDAFISSGKEESIEEIMPAKKSLSKIRKRYSFVKELIPYKMRLIRYALGNEFYYLATTILDKNISIEDYKESYHARWGHEEFYKLYKTVLGVTKFHGKSEPFIRQELNAGALILTLNRIISNLVEEHLSENIDLSKCSPTEFCKSRKVNTKTQLTEVLRVLEPIIGKGGKPLEELIATIAERSIKNSYKTRAGRSYQRINHTPINKWQKVAKKDNMNT